MRIISLKNKLLLFSLVLSIVLTLLIALIEVEYEIRSYRTNLLEDLHHFEKTHHQYLSSRLWAMEYDSLRVFVLAEERQRLVDFIKIYDLRHELVAQSGGKPAKGVISHEFKLTHLHNDRIIDIGRVEVGGSVPGIPDLLRSRWVDFFLLNGLLVVVIITSSYLLFYRHVFVRLLRIIDFTDASTLEESSGELPGETGERGGDEIDMLARSLAVRSQRINSEFQRRISAESQLKEKNRALIREIEERQQVEDELLRSEEKYRLIIENQSDLIVKVDTEGRLLFVSQSYCEMFGQREEGLLGEKFMPLVHPDDRKATELAMLKLYQPPHRAYIEQRVQAITGWRWIAWLDTAILDEHNQVSAIVGVGRDITEQKEFEEALKNSQKTFLSVLDGIDAAIYVADMQSYEILFANKYCIELFGEEMAGKACYAVFRHSGVPCTFCTNEQLLDSDGRPSGVCVWQDENPVNGRFYVNHDRAIEWIDGRIVRLQISTDITEFKRLEEQLQQARKMESIGRLAGGVAHDFNNMLSIIQGNAEMAFDDLGLAHPACHHLKEILRAADRSADFTRQLLAFARKQAIAPQVLDLNQTIAGMLKMLERLIGEDINLVWEPGADLCPVKMDPSQVDQILANLMVNARDAIHDIGTVSISTARVYLDNTSPVNEEGGKAGYFAEITVRDTGHGMDEEILSRLFEPFFTTKGTGKGTGLGLATVYGIVKQNEGVVRVKSQPGTGTVFHVFLPEYEGYPTAYEQEEELESVGGEETILLVEDERAILEMTADMLSRQGYTVLAADTPEAALELEAAHSGTVDLLMTDVIMPGMNGRDMAEKIKASRSGIKCLFMSGYTADVIGQHGVLESNEWFLQKPFSRADATKKIREVLDSSVTKYV